MQENTFLLSFFFFFFFSFLSSIGILHHSTCPHTPQQNEIVELKNYHLIETCILLQHYNVALRFCGDVVPTTCFLINHMPSSILNNQASNSIIFSNQTLYLVPPHVMGYVCFVHGLSLSLNKLFAKAVKYIFLGYWAHLHQLMFSLFWLM